MKQFKITLSALIMGLLLSVNAQARDNEGPFFGKEATGDWIIGLKIAQIDINLEGFEDADADTVGAIIGYEFDKRLDGGGTSTVELEYLASDKTDLGSFGEYDSDMVNLFFTYRSAGQLYFKFKGGLSYSDIRFDVPAFNESFEEVSLAGGLGLGLRIGDYGSVELEYAVSASDHGVLILNGSEYEVLDNMGVLGLNILFEF